MLDFLCHLMIYIFMVFIKLNEIIVAENNFGVFIFHGCFFTITLFYSYNQHPILSYLNYFFQWTFICCNAYFWQLFFKFSSLHFLLIMPFLFISIKHSMLAFFTKYLFTLLKTLFLCLLITRLFTSMFLY